MQSSKAISPRIWQSSKDRCNIYLGLRKKLLLLGLIADQRPARKACLSRILYTQLTFATYRCKCCSLYLIQLLSKLCKFLVENCRRTTILSNIQSQRVQQPIPLQVCKYRAIFNINCSHKYCQIPNAQACFHILMQNTAGVQHKQNEFDNSTR